MKKTPLPSTFRRLFFVASIISGLAVPAQTVRIAVSGNNGYGEAWVPADLPNVKTAIIEANSGLALLSNGRLAAWGRNFDEPACDGRQRFQCARDKSASVFSGF